VVVKEGGRGEGSKGGDGVCSSNLVVFIYIYIIYLFIFFDKC
jgi:hypothetical protein